MPFVCTCVCLHNLHIQLACNTGFSLKIPSLHLDAMPWRCHMCTCKQALAYTAPSFLLLSKSCVCTCTHQGPVTSTPASDQGDLLRFSSSIFAQWSSKGVQLKADWVTSFYVGNFGKIFIPFPHMLRAASEAFQAMNVVEEMLC